MARRSRTTAKVVAVARRNIRKAQLSRVRTREPRSVGRVYRSRARYTKPAVSGIGRIRVGRRTR